MDILVFVIGLYVVLESIYAAMHLDKGGKICQFIKYLTCAITGTSACYFSAKFSINSFISNDLFLPFIFSLLAITFSLWPETFYRFITHYDRRSKS